MFLIPRKYSNMLIAALMPFAISFVATFYHTYATADSLMSIGFIATWLGSWFRAYALALPVSLFSAPFIRKFVSNITH